VNGIKLQPLFETKRHRCPFYGFNHNGEFSCFDDSRGKQCGAILDGFTLCQMEFKGEVPNWNECSLNSGNRARIEYIKNHYKFFPWEFPSVGLSFQDWLEYVMSHEVAK
jgi:hypothetical protein